MQIEDLCKQVDGEWEEVPLNKVYWRDYKIQVLVDRDFADRPDLDFVQTWEALKDRVDGWIERSSRPGYSASTTLQPGDLVLYDLLRAYTVRTLVSGPCHDAMPCSRPFGPEGANYPAHVITAEEAVADDCPDCEAEAERWHEQRYS